MNFLLECNPLFEAVIYLSYRCLSNRAVVSVAEIKNKYINNRNIDWEYCHKIVELEGALDALYPITGILAEYFSPINTKTALPELSSLSIGEILLLFPVENAHTMPSSFESLLRFYQEASASDVYSHFANVLSSLFNNRGYNCSGTLETLLPIIEDIIENPADKWRIIDAATNPMVHLKKLKNLVNAVMQSIVEFRFDFSDAIAASKATFFHTSEDNRLRFLRISPKKNKTRIEVYPSLFLLNRAIVYVSEKGKYTVFLGILVPIGLYQNEMAINIEALVSTIKVLGDETRIHILHELCDNYSYGQKLAEMFGGTPNAIYYHLEKLTYCELLDCQATDYRMLYTMNKKNVYNRLTALRDYLLNGWKPEDEAEEGTETPEGGGGGSPAE